jgi:putative Ca2+/H+ antiporter (TMEM165/GDT1 family)
LMPQHSADAEFAEAEQAEAAGTNRGFLNQQITAQHGSKELLRTILEVAAVMFLAKWGDRCMLATVALGAAQVGHRPNFRARHAHWAAGLCPVRLFELAWNLF